MGTHDHIGDLPPAGDEEADLAVDLTGEFRQRPGQFVGDDPIRSATPPVELPDPLDLLRSEAGEVAVYFFYGRSLLMASYKGRMPRCASPFVTTAYAKSTPPSSGFARLACGLYTKPSVCGLST
jgi:hypothetical protein